MSKFDAQAIAEIVAMTEEMLTAAGFTGVKMARAPVSDAVIARFREEDPDDVPDPAAFGAEIHYHRVTTDQGSFGIRFEPYVTLDLYGTGLDIKTLLPRDASAEDVPDDWSLIGIDEGTLEKLFIELIKKSRQP